MKNRKRTGRIFSTAFILALWGGWALLARPVLGGTLSFSKPEKLATLPWLDGSNHGVPPSGPEWLMVDKQSRFVLESNLDFVLYTPAAKYLQTLQPIDKSKNFYGFTAMESASDGSLLLFARLETPQEQWGKDNFQEHSKPGARLIVLSPDGQVKKDKEELDADQPHSSYYLEDGVAYSVRDDGSYKVLDSFDGRPAKEGAFTQFASFASSPANWLDHLKHLSVFHSGNRFYHDTKGQTHPVPGATASLMGQNLVEGTGPLAIRKGVIYYQVVCDKNQDFINAVFVEDPVRKNYGLVDLFRSEEELDMVHGHTVFVDSKGNLFEGVGKKDGYRIYEWKRIN